LGGVLVDASHRVAEVGETGARNQADIAGSDHGDTHGQAPLINRPRRNSPGRGDIPVTVGCKPRKIQRKRTADPMDRPSLMSFNLEAFGGRSRPAPSGLRS